MLRPNPVGIRAPRPAADDGGGPSVRMASTGAASQRQAGGHERVSDAVRAQYQSTRLTSEVPVPFEPSSRVTVMEIARVAST